MKGAIGLWALLLASCGGAHDGPAGEQTLGAMMEGVESGETPETEAEADSEVEAESEAEAEAEAGTESEAGTGAEADSEAEAEPEASADPEPETEAESEAEAESQAEADPETEADSETDDCADGTCDEDQCAVDNGGCGDARFVACADDASGPPTCVDIDECEADNGGCGNPTFTRCIDREGASPHCVDIDECAVDNGGCGSPVFTSCRNRDDAPPLCTDIDECATDNGGCGDPAFTRCTNRVEAIPLCTDIDECATDNGGCGDRVFTLCTNREEAPPLCTDIDECETANGFCGDPAFTSCRNRDGAPPLCTDIDECETDNGGCGDPEYTLCANREEAPPSCTDIDECATDNGGCGDPWLFRCVDQAGAAPICEAREHCSLGDADCELGCLSGIDGFGTAGPFSFTTDGVGRVKFWVPDVPAGCKVPLVHLANASGANCSFYLPSIERLASHGFLTLCYEDTETGAGTQGLEAFQTALETYPDLAALRFGSTGHSQGGQAAFALTHLAEDEWGAEGLYAGLAMQPTAGFGQQPEGGWRPTYAAIRSPMLMFSGQQTDGLVSQRWVQDGFDALSDDVEAYHWSEENGDHFEPNGPMMQLSIAWFRWKLLGDRDACRAFKQIRELDPKWLEAAVQNEAPCL